MTPGAFSTNTPLCELPRSSLASASVPMWLLEMVLPVAPACLTATPFSPLPEITFCAAFAAPPTTLPDERSVTPSDPLPRSVSPAAFVPMKLPSIAVLSASGLTKTPSSPKRFMTSPLIVVPAAPAPDTASPNAFAGALAPLSWILSTALLAFVVAPLGTAPVCE
jgi:hypothetical protein